MSKIGDDESLESEIYSEEEEYIDDEKVSSSSPSTKVAISRNKGL